MVWNYRIKGTIKYKVLPNHPDIRLIDEYSSEKVYNYSDVYTFHDDATLDQCEEYMRRDLALVAGGGYDTKGIEVVGYDFEEV